MKPERRPPPCHHCQLPVPAGLVRADQERQFCCQGCETAFRLIESCGLQAYYSIQDSSSAQPSPWRTDAESTSQFQEYDSEKFQTLFGRIGPEFGEITLVVEGIHCAACIWLLEKLPQILPGVIEAQVNWGRRTIHVVWALRQVSLSTVARTLSQLGYPPHPLGRATTDEHRNRDNTRQLIRLSVAAAAAGNNMLIATALYLGMFSHMTESIEHLLRWASCVLGAVSVLWPGSVFLRGAFSALRTWTPHMDLPIALGLSAGLVSGIVNTAWGSGEIYFDSLSVLVFVLILGRWIQYRQQQAAADSIEMLYRLTPKTARRIRDGVPLIVPSDLLEVGDLIEVRAGDSFAADGLVVRGETLVDQAILTGEPVPVPVGIGDQVAAGTLNRQALVQVEVTAVGLQTRIGQVMELVQESAARRPQIVQLADRRGGYFVILIMILALLTLGIWLWVDPQVAVDRTVALLVIACPCALALATPLAVSVGLARGAGRRLLIKSGDVFQRLAEGSTAWKRDRPTGGTRRAIHPTTGRIWLDKTGTLTLGQMQVQRWIGDLEMVPLMAAIQRQSNHPIAQALVQWADRQASATAQSLEANLNREAAALSTNGASIESASAVAGAATVVATPAAVQMEPSSAPAQQVQEVVQSVHGGIGGRIAGQWYWIGNRGFLQQQGVPLTSAWQRRADDCLRQGYSPIFVSRQDQVVAVAAVGDGLRPNVRRQVTWLQSQGWEVGILSGDHQDVVQQVARLIGVPPHLALGDRMPADKVQVLAQSQAECPVVVMVGDGVNDSAALAAASVGIAAHHSAEVCLQAAPVYLGQPGLSGVVQLLQLSRGTMRNIRRNFAVSLTYNLTAVALAALGYITPLGAAILMPISSMTVVALSFWPVAVSED